MALPNRYAALGLLVLGLVAALAIRELVSSGDLPREAAGSALTPESSPAESTLLAGADVPTPGSSAVKREAPIAPPVEQPQAQTAKPIEATKPSSIQERLDAQGKPFDGAEYAHARDLFRASSIADTFANPLYNPDRLEQRDEDFLGLKKVFEAANDELAKVEALRRKLEMRCLIESIEKGSGFEHVPSAVDGSITSPEPASRDEFVLCATYKGQTAAMRFRFGSLAARDELLWQQSRVLCAQEQNLLNYFRNLRR